MSSLTTSDCRLFRGADFISLTLRAAAGAGICFTDFGRGCGRAEIVARPPDAAGDDEFRRVILGFSVVFITLGAISTENRADRRAIQHTLAVVAGVVIILFGLHLTGILKIKALYSDTRLHELKGGSTPIGAFCDRLCVRFRLDSVHRTDSCRHPYLSRRARYFIERHGFAGDYSLGLAVPFCSRLC